MDVVTDTRICTPVTISKATARNIIMHLQF